MDSKSYWEQRAVDSIGRMEKAVNGQIPDLVNVFEAAKRDLNDQVERFFVRYAKNNKISLADAQKQLLFSELKDFRGDLAEYEKLAKKSIGTFNLQVDNLSVKARITRLEALQTQCDAVLQKLYQERRDQISGTATDIYTSEYYHTLFNVEKYTGFKFNYSQPATSTIQKVIQQPVAGMDISEHLWRQDIDTGFKIRTTLNNMFVTGKPPQYFADQLQKQIGAVRVDKAGKVTGTGKKYEAYRLLYTESAHVTNQAQLQACEDDGIDEFEDIVSLDSHTCPDCAYFDGKHYPVSKAIEGLNCPPWHPFCRCTTAPYIPELAGLSDTRAARGEDGDTEPVDDQTYDEWKTQQDEKYRPGREEYQQIKDSGLKRVPDIDTFQKQRYNNSPEYQKLMQRQTDIQGGGEWKAAEFSPQTSSDHFERHGANVGAKDVTEYQAAALKFVNDTPGKETVIDSDGVRRFYLPATNEFASAYPDGTISTYYKPRQGMKYWERQVKKYGSKEK